MINQMNDCNTGDWRMIGSKDGAAGLPQKFSDRADFCSRMTDTRASQGSMSLYVDGWNAGNQQFWFQLGCADGLQGLPVSQFQQQIRSELVVKNQTPVQSNFYEDGWRQGNRDFWIQVGSNDGRAGKVADENAARAAVNALVGFNAEGYQQGWQSGNYSYWEQLGYLDAHAGIPDSNLQQLTTSAKSRNLVVRPDAYQAGWNREIPEYWRNLGWNDAASGREFNGRKDEAQRRGLKIYEAQYRQRWEARLIQYWTEIGTADGYGKPYLIEQRIAEARSLGYFVIAQTRDIYGAAWSQKNA